MNSNFFRIVVGLFFCCYYLLANAQTWNLVWREDFGVAEDTVIKNFADRSNSVPGHCFIDDERFCNGQIVWDAASNSNICDGFYDCRLKTGGTAGCGTIDDGFYGITNNTWWAYNRWTSCKMNAGHFVAGKDHTGNKNGAMLVINSGVGEGDAIFSKKIEFNLCDSREYRFVIYVASITAYGNDDPADPSGGNADLEMNVINTSTGKIVETIRTGAIPYWTSNGWGDSGGGIADTKAERLWSEYSCEFVANDGDVLELQVTNWGSGYNDFAIDDISLYRKDTEEVPDPIISTNTIASSSTIVDGCIFMAAFKVPDDVLPAWKNIYDNVYFLWQKSEDDGLSWQNVLEVSGIEKTSVDIEVDKEVPTVYRVIITGGSSESIAEEQALYIAQNGAPKDGCAYYSISNTLAGVSPTPDCSFSESARVVWKEDFGVLDSFSTRPFDGAVLHYYEPTTDGFKIGDYVVTSAPDSSVKKINESWDGSFLGYSYNEKSLQDPSGNPNGAFLYTYFGKKSAVDDENVLIEKTIDGPFCKCKSFNFSFQFYDFNEWAGENLDVLILDEADNLLASSTIAISNSNSRRWVRSVTPFVLPLNYSGGIKFKILNATPTNNWNYICFDDFQIAVCGETTPKGSIQIDNDPSLTYLDGFSCNEEPYHTVNILDDSEWKSTFPNYGFAWQYSDDGENWAFLSDKASVAHEADAGLLVNYRLVLAETAEDAIYIAKNGKPQDPCVVYGFSNVVGLKCKEDGCKAPIFEFDMEMDTMAICSNAEEKVTLSVVQKNKTKVDKMQWYSSPADKATWSAIEGATEETLSVLPADSTDYLFIALNDTCYSDSIFARINVHEMIVFDELKNESGVLCDFDDGYEITYKLLSGNPTEFFWNDTKAESASFVFEDLVENDSIRLSFYATDGVCLSDVMKDTFWVEARTQFVWDKFDYVVCEGGVLELNFPQDLADYYESIAWQSIWEMDGVEYSRNYSETFDITKKTTLKHILESEICYSEEYVFNVDFIAKPELSLSAEVDSVCLGTSVVLSASSSVEDLLGWQLVKIVDGTNEVVSTEQKEAYTLDPTESAAYFIFIPDNGCGEFSSDTVMIVVDKPVDYTFESVPEKVCAGDEVTLKATSIGAEAKSSLWLKNGVVVSSDLVFVDEPSELTSYQFAADAGVCPAFTKSFEVDVEVASDLSISAEKDYICEGDNILLSATFGETESIEWQYSTDNVNFQTFSTDLSNQISFDQLQDFYPTYFFRLKAEGSGLCPVVYSKTIMVEVEPVLDLVWPKDKIVCKGFSLDLGQNLTEEQKALYSFSWELNGVEVGSDAMYKTPEMQEYSEYLYSIKSKVCPTISHKYRIAVVTLELMTDKENVCEGDDVTLTANYTNVQDGLLWQSAPLDDSLSFETFSSDVVEKMTLNPTSSKQYWLEYSGNCICDHEVRSNVVVVAVEEAIEVNLEDAPTAVCFGSEVNLTATQTKGVDKEHEWLKNGVLFPSSSEYLLTDVPTENPTTYSFVTKGIYCKNDTQSVSIAVERSAELTLSADATELCQNSEFTLSANYGEATILNWEKSLDGENFESFSSELTPSQKVVADKSAYYRLSSVGTGVCDAVFSNVVNVDVEENIVFELPDDRLICPGESFEIMLSSTSSPQQWIWEEKTLNGEYSLSNLSGLHVALQPSQSMTYRLTADMKVCEDFSDEIEIKVDEIPVLNLQASASDICQGDVVALTTDFPYGNSLVWEESTTGDYSSIVTSSLGISVTPQQTTSYRLSATSEAGCPVEAKEVTIQVDEAIEVTIEDLFVCEGDEAVLSPVGNDAYSYLWSDSEAFDTILHAEKVFAFTPSQSAVYYLSVKNGLCERVYSPMVTVSPIPKIISAEDIGNKSFSLVTEGGTAPLMFDFGDGRMPTSSNILDKVIYGKTYNVTVSDDLGCSSSFVLETPTYELVIPDVFNANEQLWYVDNLDKYSNSRVTIYDRIGRVLLEMDGSDFSGWDGTYNGHLMPSTDYWYEINVGEIDMQYIGHFTLVRF